MKKIKFYLAGLALAGLTFYACDKNDDNSSSGNDTDMLKTSAIADRIYETDFQTGNETAANQNTMESRPGSGSAIPSTSCATVTQVGTGITFPLTFKVDFGSGCTSNGITRSGSLNITFTGFLLTNGSQMIIERNNYVVNGYHVSGTVTYTNQTTNSDTPQWSRTVTNGQITTPSGAVYTNTNTRVVRQVGGVGTPLIVSDNVYNVISGSATITNSAGATLTGNITSALTVSASCSYITQGVIHLQGSWLNGDLDYGTGDCDNTATYTHSDGTVYPIVLN